VTKAVINGLLERIHNLQEELGTNAGVDPLQDRRTVGAIAAYNDIVNIDVAEVVND